MDYNSGDSLASGGDFEVFFFEDVERENGREEEGSGGEVGQNNSEGFSKSSSKREGEEERDRIVEGGGKRRADMKFNGDMEDKKRKVDWIVDVEDDKNIDSSDLYKSWCSWFHASEADPVDAGSETSSGRRRIESNSSGTTVRSLLMAEKTVLRKPLRYPDVFSGMGEDLVYLPD